MKTEASPSGPPGPRPAAFAPGRRLAAFDCLRAYAAIVVVISHYWYEYALPSLVAPLSRQFLLVLSAFFLTGILLRFSQTHPGFALRPIWRFHLRRWLRIYPVYIVAVLGSAILLARLGDVRLWSELPWHLTQMTSLLVFDHGRWGGPGDHLWTLSAIEHFYLIWPFVLLGSGERRWLASAVMTIIGPMALGIALIVYPESSTNKVLMPACLHFFAAGGMLAMLPGSEPVHRIDRAIRDNFLRATAAIWPWALAWGVLVCFRAQAPLLKIAADFTAAFGMAAIVRRIALRSEDTTGFFLNHPVIAYIGRTGFPIYILHPFVRQALELENHAQHWGISALTIRFVAIGLTLIFAAILHETLEKPLTRWRSRI